MSVAPVISSQPSASLGFNPAAVRNANPQAQRAAVAAQFEAILVRQMLGQTMNSMLGGSGAGAAGSVYGDMLTDVFSQQLTAGRGLGMARYIEQQLTPRGELVPPTNAPAAASATSTVQPGSVAHTQS